MIITIQPPNVVSLVQGSSNNVLIQTQPPVVLNVPQSVTVTAYAPHGHDLDDISPVEGTNGQVITNVAGVWGMTTPVAVGHTHPVSDLTQTGATTNQLLKWNGSAWVPSTQTTLAHTHGLEDLTQSGASLNDIVQWTGADWEAVAPSFAPQIASFVTTGTESGLSNERVLTSSDHITIVDGGTMVTPEFQFMVKKQIIAHAEFVNSLAPWGAEQNGSGAAAVANLAGQFDADCGGQCVLSTGTSSSGRSAVGTPITAGTTTGTMYMTSGAFIMAARVRVRALSTSAQRYWTKVGYQYDYNVKTGPGIHFTYQDNVNGGRWYFECSNFDGDTATPIDTGVTVVADTWYRLEIIGNAGTPTATGYINGVNVGTFNTAGTMPFGLTPAFSVQPLGLAVALKKTVGNTSVQVVCDYLSFSQKVNR